MKEEVLKLEAMQKMLQDFIDSLFNYYRSYTREMVFAGMIVKKTMDILAASTYCVKNSIVSVQISLLRLLCDNCLAIEAANQIGLVEYMEMIKNNQKVSSIMIDEEQNMSDGYLKRLVAKDYPGFDRVYSFACESVHFSKQALSSAFKQNGDKISSHIEVGNKEYKDEIVSNNNQVITLCKVIMDMLKKLCYKR